MASGAEAGVCCSPRAVAPGKIGIVDEVIFGLRPLVAQVDMARITALGAPLIAVGVAAHAGGHRRTQRVRLLLHIEMTPDAVAVRAPEVCLVLEPQVLACERRGLAC